MRVIERVVLRYLALAQQRLKGAVDLAEIAVAPALSLC